jgi:hypothetical protein
VPACTSLPDIDTHTLSFVSYYTPVGYIYIPTRKLVNFHPIFGIESQNVTHIRIDISQRFGGKYHEKSDIWNNRNIYPSLPHFVRRTSSNSTGYTQEGVYREELLHDSGFDRIDGEGHVDSGR